MKAYEDILRHKMDASINNELARVVRNGKFIHIKKMDIMVNKLKRFFKEKL